MWLRRGARSGAAGVLSGVLLGLLGSGCTEKEPSVFTEKTWDWAVARMVTVRGLVTDGETGSGVAGAEITLPDGERAVTGADGHFQLSTSPGRKRVEVKSSEHLRFTYELVAGEVEFDSSIKVARRGPSQLVGLTGGTLMTEEALIEVPAGAYPDGSSVSVTSLKRNRVAAVPAPAQFVDDKGVPRRVVGVVAMEGSSNPLVPLRVRTPVAPDATMDTVQLHRIDAQGEWTDPKRPESIVAGMATFAVSDDGQYGVTMDAARSDAKRIGYVVTDSGDSSVAAGSVLSGGTQVAAGKRVVSVVDPRGATIEVAPNSLVTLDDPAGADGAGTGDGTSGPEGMAAPFAGRVRAQVGEGRVVVRRRAAAAQANDTYKLTVDLPSVDLAVKGTAFTYKSCPHGEGTLDTVGVVEGDVDAFFDGETDGIGAGQSRTFCETCSEDSMPVCGAMPEAPQMPRLTVAPSEISFDDLMSGEVSPPRTITLTNAGNAATGALTVELSGGPFEIMADGCKAALPSGASCQLSVLFKPTAAGNAQGEVTISGAPGGTASVTLAGQGLGPPRLSVLPGALRFELQAAGSESARQTLTFRNEGDLPTGGLASRLQGAGAGNFRIVQDGCTDRTLAARAFCDVEVTFFPGTTGELEAEVGVSGSPGGDAVAAVQGRGLEPALLVASTRLLAFGDQLVGDATAVHTVEISNAGEVASGHLALMNFHNGGAFDLVEDGCWNVRLEPGGVCRMSLQFRPAQAGAAAGQLDVAAVPGGIVTIALQGTGLNPARLVMAPGSHTFPNLVLGTTSESQTFTITNEGDAPSGALQSAVTGGDAGQFRIAGDECAGQTLAAHASCTLEVVFAPTEADENNAALVVTGLPGGNSSAQLYGRGLAPAQLAVTPGAVSFPDQLVGTTGTPALFTITNQGDVPAGTVTVTLGGTAANQYEITASDCGPALAPHASCTALLVFRPTVGGTAAAAINATAAPGGAASATLAGRGLAPANLVAAPTSVAFGDQLVGSSSTVHAVVVTNTGEVPAGPIASGVGGVSAPQFQVNDGCQGVALAPGASCTMNVTFVPSVAGDAIASLFFEASPGGGAGVGLTGRSQMPAHIVVAPPSIAFGDRVLGDPGAEVAVLVTNEGDVPTGALGTALGGAGAAQFQIGTNGCAGLALAGNSSCTVGIIFHPSAAGDAAAALTVSGAPGGNGTTTLSGHGLVPASLQVVPAAVTFGDTVVGSASAPHTFTFTNSGDLPTGPIAVATGGAGSAHYRIQIDNCSGAPLPPHGSCTVSVIFQPIAAGDVPPAALAAAGAPGGSTSASLSGRGRRPAQLRIDPPETYFGSHPVGSTSPIRTLTVHNDGEEPTGVPDGFLEGAGGQQFETTELPACANLPLPPGGSCRLDFRFHPQVVGDAQSVLTVRSTPGGSATALLTGNATEGPRLTIAPPEHDFGPMPPGLSGQTNFLVTNAGAVPSSPLTSVLDGPDLSEYSIVEDGCSGRDLAPSSNCLVTVRFSPHGPGFRSVNLTVRTSVGAAVSALLRGSGGEGGGSCTPDSCGPGMLCCGPPQQTFCSDPRFDQQNCGACGNVCPAGQFCNNGVCGCSPMQAQCNGVCTNLHGDPDNCGACGNVCPAGNRFCTQSPEGPRCQPCGSVGQIECDNRCVDTRFDQQNCGACGNACAANQACIDGACVTSTCALSCGPGSLCCQSGPGPEGQRCTDARFDPGNCGGCGIVCGGGRSCNNGVCGCQPGQVECNGVCSYVFGGDPDNCGACGNVCPAGNRFCGNGPEGPGCQPCSQAGQTECGGRCIDTRNDNQNCGACGNTCGPNQGCVNGACVTGSCALSCGGGAICCIGAAGTPDAGREMCTSPLYDQNNCGGCGITCGGGKFCQNGVCACNPMQAECNGVCSNLFGDPDNCGGCGNVCPQGNRFCGHGPEGSGCQPCSAINQIECGGRCADTHNDPANCGACGNACAAGQACVAGACVSGTCALSCGTGVVCCERSGPEGSFPQCTDLRYDQQNCGGCGITCGGGQYCSNGVCGCQPGQVDCNGVCVNPQGGDPDNCGACGNACPAGSRFCGFAPQDREPTCHPCSLIGQTECGGRCIDMQNDQNNCGACGNACGAGQACVAGACVSGSCALSCGTGAICCLSGAPEPGREFCADPHHDYSNCGGCGISCTGGQFCQNGACICPGGQQSCNGVCAFVQGGDPDHCGSCANVCPPGSRHCGEGPGGATCQPCGVVSQTECNGRCVDTRNDQNNCGTCGTSCATGEACVNGACVAGSCSLSCAPGYLCCGPPNQPFCSDPRRDFNNCGACGVTCGPGQACNNGQCVCNDPSQTSCGGVCRSLQHDPDACGACGNVCPPESRFCVADPIPSCRPCPGPGQQLCADQCIDTRNDRDNCGECGNSCGEGNSCLNGTCVVGTCTISCGGGSICCGTEATGQFCTYPGQDRNNCGGCGIVCGNTLSCLNGVCGCQSYEAICGGTCSYLFADADNCGACGNVCPEGNRFCNGGTCRPCSDVGQSECGGRCIDMQNDLNNCGDCGNVCGEGQACVAGRCLEGTCSISCGGGSICCGSEATGQFCTYPGQDRNNCGGCGNVCADTQSCLNGSCGCQSYEANCDGTCSYLFADSNNCGACGNVCPEGNRFCNGGTCRPCSDVGQSECGGRCIDMQNDQNNCGGCGNVCGEGQACVAGRCLEGTCSISCGGGSICCGSEATGQFCTYAGQDRNNCGGCGIVCADTQSCLNGFCGCQSYEASCDGTCSYLFADSNNCGACGNVCPEGNRHCNGGTCQPCETMGQTECDGRCVDTRNDQQNCGDCGSICESNQACINGTCVSGQ